MFKVFILLVTFWSIYLKAHAYTEDHRRELKVGELVIHGTSIHEVLEKNRDTYFIRNLRHANSVSAIERDELAVMDGCLDKMCVHEVAFDVGYLRYVTIEGITYDGEYIVEASKDWTGYYQPIKNNLAATSGCLPNCLRKLCVGEKVKDFTGNVMTIIGLHSSGELVLKSNDGWDTYRSFVDEDSVSLIDE
jgi:hypothetical protein